MEIKNYFAQDAQGNIMPSANCYLYLPGTTTLATGLVDGNGTPISNPFLASSIGQVTFGAPNGVYDLRISQGSRNTTIEIQCADLLQALNETASFLGAKSSAPTTRNDGSALQIADRYLNTSDQLEYLYKSTGWVANNLDGQLLATSRGASLLGALMQDGSPGTIQEAIDEGDNSLRQELAGPSGASKLGSPDGIIEPTFSQAGTAANKFAVAPISLWDFVGFLSAGDRSGAPDEWDWSAAITALNDAVKARIRKFAPLLGDRFNYIESLVRVDLTGVFGYSNTLILWPGVRYDLDVASRLYARAAGQCMVRTPTVAELAASPAGATYGSKNSGLTGGGYVDGANLASVGALLDTVAAGCRYDVTIVRCTNSRFTTTGTGSAGSSDLTVASAANIQKYDVVYIAADMLTSPARKGNQYYIVKSITGNVVTFTMPLSSALSGATVVHRAVGAIGAMAQQSKIELNTTWNDIGQVWCQNSDGFRCTDISISGMSHENMVGTVIAGFEGMLVKPTIQHNYGSELVIVETIGMSLYTPFIESLSDASANTNSTPTGGAPIGASALRGFPMIDIRDNARNVRFIDISWPPNSGSVQFRRLLSNQGLHTLVDGARGQLATLNENPDAPGEVAPFLAYSIGSMRVINFRGPTATDLAQKLVVSETGGTPVSFSASWEVFSSSVNSGRTSKTVNYSISSAEIVASYRLIGEAFDRCGVSASGINLGDGSVAPDTLLRRTSSGVAGADGLKCVQSAWNTKHFAIGNFEWWMTAGSRPRFASGPPTSDASGVAVSCTVPVPGSATSPGQPGDEAASATFIYKYIGDGTTHSWVRSAATSW